MTIEDAGSPSLATLSVNTQNRRGGGGGRAAYSRQVMNSDLSDCCHCCFSILDGDWHGLRADLVGTCLQIWRAGGWVGEVAVCWDAEPNPEDQHRSLESGP